MILVLIVFREFKLLVSMGLQNYHVDSPVVSVGDRITAADLISPSVYKKLHSGELHHHSMYCVVTVCYPSR